MQTPEERALVSVTRKYYRNLIKQQNYEEIQKAFQDVDSMSEPFCVLSAILRTTFCIKEHLPQYNFYLAKFKQSVTYRGGNAKARFSGLSTNYSNNFNISCMHNKGFNNASI